MIIDYIGPSQIHRNNHEARISQRRSKKERKQKKGYEILKVCQRLHLFIFLPKNQNETSEEEEDPASVMLYDRCITFNYFFFFSLKYPQTC